MSCVVQGRLQMFWCKGICYAAGMRVHTLKVCACVKRRSVQCGACGAVGS